MKVLFCTDGSKISYNAIKNFSNWVKDFETDVICVIDWSFLPDTISVEDSKFAVQCANSADAILEYSEQYLKENNIKINEKIKMCGATSDTILEIAQNNYDFIVLGSHGKKGLQKWLGSVSQEVSSSAKISTYISKDKNECKKILFTIDQSELSAKVITKCIQTLNLKEKEIHLLTSYEIPDYLFIEGNIDSSWIAQIEKKQQVSCGVLLNSYEKQLCENNIEVKSKVTLKGEPAKEIIKYAQNNDIDLIISAIRNRDKFSKFILPSISKRVLENVKSDVLIMRNV